MDTFGGNGARNSTRNLVENVRRDLGLNQRSPSPAGSASSLEGLDTDSSNKRKKTYNARSQKQMSASSVAKITMNAVKETMKMMSNGKRRKVMDDSSSGSEDEQNPILVDDTFKVKDNGHDVLDFKIRNSLRTINAKPKTYYKYLNKKVEPQLETLEVDHLTANTINPRIVKKVHDMNAHLELKYFDVGNITVESRAPKAKFSAR